VLDVKNIFVAPPGMVLLEADFNQHEYRVTAGVAQDNLMMEIFRKDRVNYEQVLRGEKSWRWYKDPLHGVVVDMHRANAAETFGVPYAEVTKEQRRNAKALGFGVLYGMGTRKLAATLGVTEREAESYLRAYFQKFTGIAEWKQSAKMFLWQHKYVVSCTGRRRHFPHLDDDATREGLNTLIQGPASDFMLIALTKTEDRLVAEGLMSRVLLQVHDSICVALVLDELAKVVDILRDSMEHASDKYLDIPLQADFSIGTRWGNMIDLWIWEENGRKF